MWCPYLYLDLDDEDSLTERFHKKTQVGAVDIVVIRLPRISNYTDFNVFECLEEVSVRYIFTPVQLGNPDIIFIPGSKNTIEDLLWMRQNGLEAKIMQHAAEGKIVIGVWWISNVGRENLIFAIGNAPTALVKLYEEIKNGAPKPKLIIGVPVGFVNVVQSKELIMKLDVPYIVARGRKGGSNVAAAICNALLYQMDKNR